MLMHPPVSVIELHWRVLLQQSDACLHEACLAEGHSANNRLQDATERSELQLQLQDEDPIYAGVLRNPHPCIGQNMLRSTHQQARTISQASRSFQKRSPLSINASQTTRRPSGEFWLQKQASHVHKNFQVKARRTQSDGL